MYCVHCGSSVADGSLVCSQCGKRLDAEYYPQAPAPARIRSGSTAPASIGKSLGGFVHWVMHANRTTQLLLALGFIALIGGIYSSSIHQTPPIAIQQTPPTANPVGTVAAKPSRITEAERDYLGAAASYLKTGNDEGMHVAQTMAGASNGSSTLGDIRTAISSAKRIENAGYQGDYKNRIKGNIPDSVTDIATNIDKTHRLFQAAMNELLEYWADQNTAHITIGSDALKRCVTVMNATIAQTTEKMKQLGEEAPR